MPRRRAVPAEQEATKPPEPSPQTNARFASGWTLPLRPQEWGAIDLSTIAATLPRPGVYPGTVADVRLFDCVDVLWMRVRYRLEGIEAEPAPDMAPIAACPGSAHAHRVREGARLLHRLAAATGVDLPKALDPQDIRALFEGKPVVLKLAHKVRDGVPELVVREISPR
jgi:hypothetical protein